MSGLDTAEVVLDGRQIPCQIKHGLVIQTCLALPANGTFVLLNGKDPGGVLHDLTTDYPGQFTWEYLESGPELYRLRFRRV